MLHEIKSRKIKILINELGAEITSLLVNGKEMIWQNPNGAWAGHAPTMFPYCGHVQINHKGVKYKEHLHGFAQFCQFSVEQKVENSITLKLTSNEFSKEYYPFDFNFYVTFTIIDDTLTINHKIENISNEPLYFGFGGHESYNLDQDVENYYIEFNKVEDLVNISSDDNGPLIGENGFSTPSNKVQLDKKYFVDSLTLIFSNVKSDMVTLYKNNGEKVAQTTFKGYQNFLIWSPDNKRCICLEPWINMPDTDESVDWDVTEKKDLIKLEVGNEKSFTRTIKYF